MATTVCFHANPDNLRVLWAFDDQRPLFLSFRGGVYETSDPDEIEFLQGRCLDPQSRMWLDEEEGAFICDVCHKACKTQFALDGHTKSHNKKEA